MLAKIKKLIKKKGLNVVSVELGYRSEGTVRRWITNNKIPEVAMQKVRAYVFTQGV